MDCSDPFITRRLLSLGTSSALVLGTLMIERGRALQRPMEKNGMAAAPGMSNDQAANLDAVMRYSVAWQANDRVAQIACYHDDFTLHYFGGNPLAGDHVGKATALQVLAEVTRRTNRRLIAILDVMAGPHRAVVIARERFERGGLQAEFDRVLVYTVKDGKLLECWVYDTDQPLVHRFFAAA